MAPTHQSGLPDKAERNKEEFGSPECFESHLRLGRREIARDDGVGEPRGLVRAVAEGLIRGVAAAAQRNGGLSRQPEGVQDRKSTRLNSSHTVISYAVF